MTADAVVEKNFDSLDISVGLNHNGVGLLALDHLLVTARAVARCQSPCTADCQDGGEYPMNSFVHFSYVLSPVRIEQCNHRANVENY